MFEAALMRNHQTVEAKLMNKLIMVRRRNAFDACRFQFARRRPLGQYTEALSSIIWCESRLGTDRALSFSSQEGRSSGYSMEEIDCGELTEWVKRSAASGGPASIWRKPSSSAASSSSNANIIVADDEMELLAATGFQPETYDSLLQRLELEMQNLKAVAEQCNAYESEVRNDATLERVQGTDSTT